MSGVSDQLGEPSEAPGQADNTDTAIDESNIISLIRSLLQHEPEGREGREESGTLLWDLSIIPGVAAVMVNNMIFTVLEACLAADLPVGVDDTTDGPPTSSATDPARPVEVALGILGNLAAQSQLSHSLSQHTALLDLVTGPAFHGVSSTPALSELCRLASTALRKPGSEAWLSRLCSAAACERLVWIVQHSPDPVLHARCLDLMVALLAAEQASPLPTPPTTAQPAASSGHHNTTGLDGTAAGPCNSCVAHLTASGLLTLMKQVLQQAGMQLEGDSSGGWAGLPPLPSAPPAASCLRSSLAPPPSLASIRSVRTPQAGAGSTPASRQAGAPSGGVDTQVQQVAMPLSELSIDAVLRLVEVVGALPEADPHRQAVLGDVQLAEHVVRLLHSSPGEQVLESLLLALQALGNNAVRVLASSLKNASALLDCLGELPSGERGAWQRELVLYSLARVLRQAAVDLGQASSPVSGHGSPAHGSDTAQPSSDQAAQATAGHQRCDDWHEEHTLVDVATRVSGLHDTCAVSGSHITGYIRAMAVSLHTILSCHKGKGLTKDGQAFKLAMRALKHTIDRHID